MIRCYFDTNIRNLRNIRRLLTELSFETKNRAYVQYVINKLYSNKLMANIHEHVQEAQLLQRERASSIALSYVKRQFDVLNRLKACASIIVNVEISLNIQLI